MFSGNSEEEEDFYVEGDIFSFGNCKKEKLYLQ